MRLECHPSLWGALFPAGTPVIALPSWRQPRLLVPARSASQAWSGTRFYPAYRWSGRLFQMALRLRALVPLRRRAATAAAAMDESLAEFLADVSPEAIVSAVQVGMPGAAQKLTARLVDRTGRVVGFLKCGEQPLARERLAHEHDILRRLPAGVSPAPLKFGTAGGLTALLLAPVVGRHPPPTVAPSLALRRFAASLATSRSATLARHPSRPDGALPPPIAAALAVLDEREWRVTFRHGDLAPWNLLHTASGSLVAIDWEYGSADGLEGLDLAQYVLQVALLIARTRPAAAVARAAHVLQDSLEPIGDPLTQREGVALAIVAAFEAHRAAAREGLPDDDWRQLWRRAAWERTA